MRLLGQLGLAEAIAGAGDEEVVEIGTSERAAGGAGGRQRDGAVERARRGEAADGPAVIEGHPEAAFGIDGHAIGDAERFMLQVPARLLRLPQWVVRADLLACLKDAHSAQLEQCQQTAQRKMESLVTEFIKDLSPLALSIGPFQVLDGLFSHESNFHLQAYG